MAQEEYKEMQSFIAPRRGPIKAKGRMYYQAEDHAWNLLRIRKEILNEFRQLKERMSRFTYHMLFHSDWDELEKAMRKFKREGSPTPILIWFVKEKVSN